MATVTCQCPINNCQAEPHKGHPSCTTSADHIAVFGESTFGSGDTYGPPEGWKSVEVSGKWIEVCGPCAQANPALGS